MNKRFQILSLSGGGYRGLHVARILELIEQQIGGRIAQHFDLIAGTSIGGVLGLALALQIPASAIRETLETVGPSLFPRTPPNFLHARRLFSHPSFLGKILHALLHCHSLSSEVNDTKVAWYDPDPLAKVLKSPDYFGDKKIGDLLHPVIVPAVNYSTGLPKFFKTDHHPSFTFDRALLIRDVALGTSAAPIYFPAHKINDWRIVDGGLIANDPTQVAVHEAMMFFGIRPPLFGDSSTGNDDLRVLSIGALSPKHFADINRPLNQGLLDWGTGAFELAASAQEAMSAFMIDKHMLPGRVLRLPSIEARPESAPGMADVSAASAEILRASAINLTQNAFGLPDFVQLFNHEALTLSNVRSNLSKTRQK